MVISNCLIVMTNIHLKKESQQRMTKISLAIELVTYLWRIVLIILIDIGSPFHSCCVLSCIREETISSVQPRFMPFFFYALDYRFNGSFKSMPQIPQNGKQIP